MEKETTIDEADPKVIQDVSKTVVESNGITWSIYHVIHKHKHYIQMFKDGAFIDDEQIDDPQELEKKIRRIVKYLEGNKFKLSMIE